MQLPDRISIDPVILSGKPAIRGTRIAVALVLELLAAGVSEQELLTDYYPHLTHEDILACLDYAAQVVSEAKELPLSA